jgi:tetratricopeptide (TPR) repeat protein
VVKVDAAAEAARSRRLARAAGLLLGSFVVVLGGLWMLRGSEPEVPAAAAAPRDPFAERRQAAAPEAEPETQVRSPSAEDQRKFMDPAGAAALAYASGDYQTSFAQFEEAVRRNPQDPEALNNLGQVLVKLGRAAEALPHFSRACAINADKWSYRFNLARALGQLNRWDDSIASYRQAQQLYPDDYVTTFNLALALHKKGDDAEAVAEYTKAVALNPEDASFRMALGISYEALQKNQDAAAAYSEYLRLDPSAPDAEKVRARIAQLTRQAAPAAAPVAPAGS